MIIKYNILNQVRVLERVEMELHCTESQYYLSNFDSLLPPQISPII